jgi:hypothetical protein
LKASRQPRGQPSLLYSPCSGQVGGP